MPAGAAGGFLSLERRVLLLLRHCDWFLLSLIVILLHKISSENPLINAKKPPENELIHTFPDR